MKIVNNLKFFHLPTSPFESASILMNNWFNCFLFKPYPSTLPKANVNSCKSRAPPWSLSAAKNAVRNYIMSCRLILSEAFCFLYTVIRSVFIISFRLTARWTRVAAHRPGLEPLQPACLSQSCDLYLIHRHRILNNKMSVIICKRGSLIIITINFIDFAHRALM